MTKPKTLSTAEAASHIGVHPGTLRRWARFDREPIPFTTQDGARRYKRSDLNAWLRSKHGLTAAARSLIYARTQWKLRRRSRR